MNHLHINMQRFVGLKILTFPFNSHTKKYTIFAATLTAHKQVFNSTLTLWIVFTALTYTVELKPLVKRHQVMLHKETKPMGGLHRTNQLGLKHPLTLSKKY